MSIIMWNRVHKLEIKVPPEVNRDDLDKAFEEETGMDCDIAAQKLGDKEFKRMIQKALERLRKKPRVELTA